MPFGSEWVRDKGKWSNESFAARRLQCLSAVSGSGTPFGRPACVEAFLRSPMPFGSEWVRDQNENNRMERWNRQSPMPFGSEWVRDCVLAPKRT